MQKSSENQSIFRAFLFSYPAVFGGIWPQRQDLFVGLFFEGKDICLNELNQEFVRDYEYFLKTKKNCLNNSALKHIKNFRKLVRIAICNEWIKKDSFFGLRFKTEEVNIDFLSIDELDRIRHKKIDIPKLEKVRDICVFCYFTGLAFADVSQLTPENIIQDG